MFQTKPNLLILDEPTNHMDMLGKQALEQIVLLPVQLILQMQLMDPALSSDYQKLMELQKQLEEEEHKQETLLERMLETETELEEI